MFKNQITNLSNFQGIQLETDISIITLDDNISHTYCSKIKWEQNNYYPLGFAQLTMPYSQEIEAYWTKYSGPVIVHANLNSYNKKFTEAMVHDISKGLSLNFKKYIENQNIDKKKDKKTNKIHLQNDKYNYSFIGKVSRFKQIGKTFVLYLEDLGWKFMQKVPKEFRDTYIAGQSLDNAFQAMCEFMGIDFAYSIEDLSQYNFSSDGYSVAKGNEIIEDVPSILEEWGPKSEEEEEEEKTEDEKAADLLNSPDFENSGLIEHNKKQKQQDNKKTNDATDKALNSEVTNTLDNQNGVTDTQTTPTEKIEQYQEEFDDKIKDLFIGNTLYDSNISDAIMNYDWITVTPTAPATTSTMSTDPTLNANQNTTTNTDDKNNDNNNDTETDK